MDYNKYIQTACRRSPVCRVRCALEVPGTRYNVLYLVRGTKLKGFSQQHTRAEWQAWQLPAK